MQQRAQDGEPRRPSQNGDKPSPRDWLPVMGSNHVLMNATCVRIDTRDRGPRRESLKLRKFH